MQQTSNKTSPAQSSHQNTTLLDLHLPISLVLAQRRDKHTARRFSEPLQFSFLIQVPEISHLIRNLLAEDVLHEVPHVTLKACSEDDHISFEMRAISELETI